MNRRTSLGLLFGKKEKTTKSEAMPPPISLDPYTGPWGEAEAAHLLGRAIFGPTKSQIKSATDAGFAATINFLFQDPPAVDPPIYFEFENDPLVPLGETWVNERETPGVVGLSAKRRRSLNIWWWMNKRSANTINEKMSLFWHNHFVVAGNINGRRAYNYLNFLRTNALGNFRTLLDGITVSAAMLDYLNGTQNSANGPNENYARELLELFALGKGPTAGPGDYTTYTEEDVIQIARALTGWRAFDLNNDNDPAFSSYQTNRHDTGEKQLSHRFNDAVITNAEENEYKVVLDLILQKDECARFISRKLIRWFVHSDITDEVEMAVVEPMAQMIIADNYEVKNAVRALISSQYFFDESIRGCMLANPTDHLFKLSNTFEIDLPEDLLERYNVSKSFSAYLATTDMAIFDHPDVAGWKAYYQAPQFDKLWINAVSLPVRQTVANRLLDGFNVSGFRVEIDVISFVASLDNPTDPNDLIIETAALIFAQPLTDEQVVALKDILIPGLPDFEWTVEYGAFVGGNTDLTASIENKLKALIGTMVKMPEFHLI